MKITIPYRTKIVITAVLSSLSVLLGILENIIPYPLPGVRIGLSNISIVAAVPLLDFKYLMLIAAMKSILVPMFTGGFLLKFVISCPATFFSVIFMYIYFKLFYKICTLVSVGSVGGAVHITVQLVMVKLFLIKNLAIYGILPYFTILSILTGVFVGYLAHKMFHIIIKKDGLCIKILS